MQDDTLEVKTADKNYTEGPLEEFISQKEERTIYLIRVVIGIIVLEDCRGRVLVLIIFR